MKKMMFFCANCQEDKLHDVAVKPGELIFTCPDCSRFKKLDSSLSASDLADRIAGHKAANQGLKLVKTEGDQIEAGGMSQAEIDAVLSKLENLS